MLDSANIKVIQKSWGTQIWLNDYEMLMVMEGGTETSMHCHIGHHSQLNLLSGEAIVLVGGFSISLFKGNTFPISIGDTHKVCALRNCVIYECYDPSSRGRIVGVKPVDDIERFSQ